MSTFQVTEVSSLYKHVRTDIAEINASISRLHLIMSWALYFTSLSFYMISLDSILVGKCKQNRTQFGGNTTVVVTVLFISIK